MPLQPQTSIAFAVPPQAVLLFTIRSRNVTGSISFTFRNFTLLSHVPTNLRFLRGSMGIFLRLMLICKH
jgi:hypothetical protein